MRSIFIAIGLVVLITGSLVPMSRELRIPAQSEWAAAEVFRGWWSADAEGGARVVLHPPRWVAPALAGLGGLIVLYAIALPRRKTSPRNETEWTNYERIAFELLNPRSRGDAENY